MSFSDTIAAISSAVGPAARMIVRASGPRAPWLAQRLGVSAEQRTGAAFRCTLFFQELAVLAWVYLFRAPRSYTGEDLVEFHLSGSPVVVRMLMEELLRLGARPAEPGEFTARAYFNGRMDLTGAEGVAATIAAHSEQELSAARRLMSGELARRLTPAMDLIADTLALVEVGIDFSEEDVTFLSSQEITRRINRADEALNRLLLESARFERLTHEPQVVLVGRPNAGKSTLLNALAGRERAVVSPVAGTTRDVLSAEVALSRGTAHVIDVAGIDPEGVGPSATPEIDRKMQRHALQAVESADVVVLVEDVTDPRPRLRLLREPAILVRSKLDLMPASAAGIRSGEAAAEVAEIDVSAISGAGMDRLRRRLDAICFGESSAGTTLALNVRHVRAIVDARLALQRAAEHLHAVRTELLALELRESLDVLGSVLGRITPDDVLGRIFAGFCIGK